MQVQEIVKIILSDSLSSVLASFGNGILEKFGNVVDAKLSNFHAPAEVAQLQAHVVSAASHAAPQKQAAKEPIAPVQQVSNARYCSGEADTEWPISYGSLSLNMLPSIEFLPRVRAALRAPNTRMPTGSPCLSSVFL